MSYMILPAHKIIDFLNSKLANIRTGRVNASILDSLKIQAYGSEMSVRELATVSTPEPGQLMITPFDKTVLNDIEKSVISSNLGVNPVNDGAGIRLSFPPLTEENRKQRVKEVSAILEEAKITMRSTRQSLIKSQKAQKEEGEISEDDLRGFEKGIQKEIDQLTKELEAIVKAKEAELMAI